MKKVLILLLLCLINMACDGDSFNNSNPNIPNYTFSFEINMSLPAYSNLQFASNHIVTTDYGARGIVVFNAGSSFIAYDLACPNQSYTTCTSAMTIDGIDATCECDNTSYNLFTGQCTGQEYPMKQYRVETNGSVLTIYN